MDKTQATPKQSIVQRKREPKETHCMEEPRSEDESDEATCTLFNIPGSRWNPMMGSLNLDQIELPMEVDNDW